MLGVPPSATAAVTGLAAQREQKRNSLLGNGFLPSVLCVLAFLPVLCQSRLVSMPCPVESAILTRVQQTVWEPGRLQAMPSTLQAGHVVAGVQAQLSCFDVPPSLWKQVGSRLAACDLPLMQAFAASQLASGHPCRPLLLARKKEH